MLYKPQRLAFACLGNLATCNLLRLRGYPILQQLRLEEALLRADKANWCIVNDGTPSPAIVMGISGYIAIPSMYMAQLASIPQAASSSSAIITERW